MGGNATCSYRLAEWHVSMPCQEWTGNESKTPLAKTAAYGSLRAPCFDPSSHDSPLPCLTADGRREAESAESAPRVLGLLQASAAGPEGGLSGPERWMGRRSAHHGQQVKDRGRYVTAAPWASLASFPDSSGGSSPRKSLGTRLGLLVCMGFVRTPSAVLCLPSEGIHKTA